VSGLRIIIRIDWHIFIALRFLPTCTGLLDTCVTGAYLKLCQADCPSRSRASRSYKQHLRLMSDSQKTCLIRFNSIQYCMPCVCVQWR